MTVNKVPCFDRSTGPKFLEYSLYIAIIHSYYKAMIQINISTLKNRLSAVLKKVKKGEEVLILDREHPIAKITALSAKEGPMSEQNFLATLEQKGIIQPNKKKLPSVEWLKANSLKLKKKVSLVDQVLKEREESKW